MIRPDAIRTLTRWREALAGAGAIALGLWLWSTAPGLPALFGAALMALGAVLAVSGIRHARFRTEAEAPGMVEVEIGRASCRERV